MVETIRPDKSKPKKNKKKNTVSKGAQVAVLWRSNGYSENWHGAVPGEIELIEAQVLAAEREVYQELASLGSTQIPTVVLNGDFTHLKRTRRSG